MASSGHSSQKTASPVLSATSETSEIASRLVSEILHDVTSSINLLLQTRVFPEAEERSNSQTEDDTQVSTDACSTDQKLVHNLEHFFGLSRVFPEDGGETADTEEEDRATVAEATADHNASNIFKTLKSALKLCLRAKPKNSVQQEAGQNKDGSGGSKRTDLPLGSPSDDSRSPAVSIHCSENEQADNEELQIITAEKVPSTVSSNDLIDVRHDTPPPSGKDGQLERLQVDLPVDQKMVKPVEETGSIQPSKSSGSLELMEIEDEDLPAEKKGEDAPTPSPASSPPLADGQEEMITYRTVPSGQNLLITEREEDYQAASIAKLRVLKNNLYNIIKGFFDSLTEGQKRDISRGVYDVDFRETLTSMSRDVLSLAIETVTDFLSQADHQICSQCHDGSPTGASFQSGSRVLVTTELLTELIRKAFCISEDGIHQGFTGSIGEALCGANAADTSISVTPTMIAAIGDIFNSEVESVISKIIEASLDSKPFVVHAGTCSKFPRCRACKEWRHAVLKTLKCVLIALGRQRKTTARVQGNPAEVQGKKTRRMNFLEKLKKCKVQLVSSEHVEQAIPHSSMKFSSQDRCSSSPQDGPQTPSANNSKNCIPLELSDIEEDPTTNGPGSLSTCSIPCSDCENREAAATEQDTQPSHPKAELEISAGPQSGEAENKDAQVDVMEEDVVPAAATEPGADETQAKTRRTVLIAFRTKRRKTPQRKRLWKICCCSSCCCDDEDQD